MSTPNSLMIKEVEGLKV